ncbi:MAG: TonB-dependent receptor [Desulfobacterales bacterium]|nr:TonB-dependent receptor [Desulfobacterales bacterium]
MVFHGLNRHILIGIVAIGLLIPNPIFADKQADLSEGTSEVDDLLQSMNEEMALITIASKSKQQTISQAPSIVTVITEQEIENSGAKTLEEVMKQVVGFDTNQSPIEPNPVVSIRGLSNISNASVRLLIDGHPIGNSFGTLGYWEGFPIDMIKKIEIIRGPGSALYGDAAMVGVVNIITKDTKNEPFVSGGYGSFKTSRLTGQYTTQSDELEMYLFADHYQSNGDRKWVESDYANSGLGPIAILMGRDPSIVSSTPGYTTEGFHYSNLFAKISDDKTYTLAMLNYADTENPLSYQKTLTDHNQRKITNSFLELGQTDHISDTSNYTWKIYADYFKYDHDIESPTANTMAFVNSYLNIGFPENEYGRGIVMVKNYKIGSEILLNNKLINTVTMTTGMFYEYHNQFDSKNMANGNVTGNIILLNNIAYAPLQYLGGLVDMTDTYPGTLNEDRSILALFTQCEFDIMKAIDWESLGDGLAFTLGVRYDSYNDVGDSLNPRVGLVYELNSHWFFKTLYGKAFRAPNFNELYRKNNIVQNGNPDLNPENLTTWESSVGFQQSNHLFSSLTYFYTQVEDMIKLVPNPNQFGILFQNFGRLESHGIEGEIKYTFTDATYGYMNITYQDVKDTTHALITDYFGTTYRQPDFFVGSIPHVMANLGINMDLFNHTNLNLSLNYKSNRKRSGELRFTPDIFDPDGTLEKVDPRKPIHDRILVNTSLMFHNLGFAKGWKAQVTLYNMFNEDDRSPDPENMILNDIPRWGRHCLANLTYTF